MIRTPANLTAFQIGYITAALWSSNDYSSGRPLNADYSRYDLSPDILASMCADCDAFEAAHADDLSDSLMRHTFNDCETNDPESEYHGHNLWLTRNRHGCGYWDGDYREPEASRLTDAARSLGEVDLYVGDDGKIYHS
jgi:hypothetical protein